MIVLLYSNFSDEPLVHADDDAANAVDADEPYVPVNDGDAWGFRTTHANVPPTETTTIGQELSERSRRLETPATTPTKVIYNLIAINTLFTILSLL